VTVWISSISPNYCCHTTLWKLKHRKCLWTQVHLLRLTTKQPLHASNCTDKYFDEPHKWKFISMHVLEVSTTSTHTSSQMVNYSVSNVLFKVRRSLHQVNDQWCHWWRKKHQINCKTSKYKGHDPRIPFDESKTNLVKPAVILHWRCFEFHKVV